jgi:gamma-D-glutamyl-L-lysine dipeptidyl-peptidase
MTDTAIAVPVTTVWTGPDAPRECDAPAIADSPDMMAWTESMDAANRHELHGRTLTQALLGEPVVVTEERAGWARVTLPWQPSEQDAAGYPGWIPAAHVGSAGKPSEWGTVAVKSQTAVCSTPEATIELSYGTALPVLAPDPDGDAIETVLALPGGRVGRVLSGSVRSTDVGSVTDVWAPLDWAMTLLESARQFVGLRYLWGGTCGWGFDCSGFVHLVHRAHGIQVPRDALDQMPAARQIPLDTARHGDLYFFARPGERPYHVGFVTPPDANGRRTMLHAPEETELIEETPLAPSRLETLVGAGTFRPEVTT